MKRTTANNITGLKANEKFVFGSNHEGYHIAGAAKVAYEKFGAAWGIGYGPTGLCYAINTMSGLHEIEKQILPFLNYVRANPGIIFFVTEIGCGIAGFTVKQIAPLFKDAVELENVYLPERFWEVLNE